MLGFFLDRRAAADSALRVNQFVRAQCRTAFLALIPVSAFAMAMGASPCDVAVGQELMLFRIVILHRRLLDETAFVVKFLEKSRCRGLMHLAGSPRINIERNAEFLKRVLDQCMIMVHNGLRRGMLFEGLDGDRHAVFVRTANENHILAPAAKVAHVNVGRHVHTCQMAYMHRAVGIRKRRSDRVTFRSAS